MEAMVPSSDMQETEEMELEGAAIGIDDADEAESLSSVYEVGYHLLPTLSEEEVAAAVKELGEFLKKNGAAMVGDRHPTKIPLAYDIPKRVAGKVMRFEEAYFGWIAFEAPRTTANELKTYLDGLQNVLRYLIIRTSKEEVAAALTGAVAAPVTGNIEKPKREAEAGGEVSEAALNQALETIQAEDAKAAE